MDRGAMISKIKASKKPLFWSFFGLGVLALAGYSGNALFKNAKTKFGHGLVHTYVEAFHSVQHKVDALKIAETEKERLEKENGHLRIQLEQLSLDCTQSSSEIRTKEIQEKLSRETGGRVGRTLASISYRPPTHLLPSQLHALGVSYFKDGEDEKSAVILTFLSELNENDNFRTPRDLLMAGISWYRVDNYELADSFLKRILEVKESPEILQLQAQARLWQALVAEKLGKHAKSQKLLRELVENHPHSVEASWVNRNNVIRTRPSRTIATEPQVSHPDEQGKSHGHH